MLTVLAPAFVEYMKFINQNPYIYLGIVNLLMIYCITLFDEKIEENDEVLNKNYVKNY